MKISLTSKQKSKVHCLLLSVILFLLLIVGCSSNDIPTKLNTATITPSVEDTKQVIHSPIGKSVVLFGTPKIIQDFDNPEPSIHAFFDHYAPFTDDVYGELILIFAVGNSEHILQYQGHDYWDMSVEWARYIGVEGQFDHAIFSDDILTYQHIHDIVLAFKSEAQQRGINFKIFDQIDQAYEFCLTNFKGVRHPESMQPDMPWTEFGGYEIMASLNADYFHYATAPHGIEQDKNAGDFLAEQTAAYVHDLEFDGILYGNQLGTRGHWHADGGPGFSETEGNAILHFFQHSKEMLGDKDLMWFDSYNELTIEHARYSVPSEAYQYLDYLMVSGFCTITTPERYMANINSKIPLRNVTRILATLDYVDPWYTYNSKDIYAYESVQLEDTAIHYFDRMDGLVMFANDEQGNLIPAEIIEDFSHDYGKKDDIPINLDLVLTDAQLIPTMRVLGYSTRLLPGSHIFKLTLYFEALTDIDVDYYLWLHGYPRDKTTLPSDTDFMIWDHLTNIPTSQWQVGHIYRDAYVITDVSGDYRLIFGFWYPHDGSYLHQNDNQASDIDLGWHKVN